MKKLFKHLAIVLALALVIGLVPARTAEAADYSLRFTNKYLYVGEKGEKAHGVDTAGNLPAKPIKRALKFGKKVIKGLKDGDVVTFKSDDATIAKGSKKFQRVFAKGVGETDVAIKVNGEEIGKMHFIVKQNAKSLSVANLPENNKFGIGDFELQINADPATATDIISVVIPEEYKDIAVVKDGTKTTITTKKPGTFKLQVVAQQNDTTLTGIHVKSEEIECEAAVKVVSAVQKSADEVLFTFDNDMTGIANAKDFKVYYKPVTGADVTTAVKAATVQDDPTKVVLKLWNAFLEGTEYYVEYSGQITKITTAKLDIEHAASIRVNELEITKGKVTEYDFDVLDANGVELPESMKSYVSFKGDSTDKIQISDSTILFDEAGLQANVTATFDAWYEDSTGAAKQNTFKNAFLFKSVDVTPVTISGYKWAISSVAIDTEDDDEFKDTTTLIAVDDEFLGASNLYFRIDFSDGTKLGYEVGNQYAYDTDDVDDAFALKIKDYVYCEIADPGIAEIKDGTILPVKVGTTQILVKVDGQDTPILVLPLDVKAKAVPQTMTITATDDKTKLNTDLASDHVEFKIVVKDQYGRAFDGAEVTAAVASKSTKTVVATEAAFVGDYTNYKGIAYIGFNNTMIGGTGVVVLKFTAAARSTKITNSTKSVQAKAAGVKAAPEDAATCKLELSSDELDQIVGDGAVDPADLAFFTEIGYYGIDGSGYRVTDTIGANVYSDEIVSGTAYGFKVFAGGTELKKTADPLAFTDGRFVSNGGFTSVSVDKDFPAYVSKLDAKSVQVKLYKIVGDGTKNKSQTSVDTKTVTITDSQPGITVKKTADNVAGSAEIPSAFTCKYNGVTFAPAEADFTAKVGNKSIYVSAVAYEDTLTGAQYLFLDGLKIEISGTVGYTLLVD